METREIRSTFNGLGFGFTIFIVLQQALVGAISFLIKVFAPQIMEAGWYMWVLSYVPLYLIAFPIACLVFRSVPDAGRDYGPPQKIVLSRGKMFQLVLICLGIVYPLNFLSTLISELIAVLKGNEVINPLGEVVFDSNPWVNILFLAIIAPIMEELIFRRMLYKKLSIYGGKTYILLSSFLFSLFHANLYQLLYAFVLGLLFSGITYYTGSIRYSITLHVLVNLIGSGISPFILAYGNELLLSIWGGLILFLMLFGIVLLIRWLLRYGQWIYFPPGAVTARGTDILTTPGMLAYMLVIAALVLLVMAG